MCEYSVYIVYTHCSLCGERERELRNRRREREGEGEGGREEGDSVLFSL